MQPFIAFLAAATCIASLTPGEAADAQASPIIATGARVRVTNGALPNCASTGRVVAVRGDSVTIESPFPPRPRTVACDSAAERIVHFANLEVSQGHRTSFGRGLVGGLVIGGATGFVLGYTLTDENPRGFFAKTPEEGAEFWGIVGAGAGLVVGGIAGLIGREQWVPAVPPGRPSLSVAPDVVQRRIAVAGSVSF